MNNPRERNSVAPVPVPACANGVSVFSHKVEILSRDEVNAKETQNELAESVHWSY